MFGKSLQLEFHQLFLKIVHFDDFKNSILLIRAGYAFILGITMQLHALVQQVSAILPAGTSV